MLISVHLEGDAFDIGYGLGRFGAAAAHRHLRPLGLWQRLAARAGSPEARHMIELVRARFPRHFRELEGLAAGLELPFDEVFLWNCRGDFVDSGVDGCTTLLAPTADGMMLAHNEDGLPSLRGHCALVHAQPREGLAFSSFAYPGSLPGHTFAVNARGLSITVNNIRPRELRPGLPRQVLARAALDAETLDAAVAVLSDPERAGAFHHGLAQAGDARLLSLEATAAGCALTEVAVPKVHANHLIDARLAHVPQRVTGSSGSRQARGDGLAQALGAKATPAQALALLRDRADAALPIHRADPNDPDDENTLATAIFVVGPRSVEWDVYTDAMAEAPSGRGLLAVTRS